MGKLGTEERKEMGRGQGFGGSAGGLGKPLPICYQYLLITYSVTGQREKEGIQDGHSEERGRCEELGSSLGRINRNEDEGEVHEGAGKLHGL